MQGGVFLKNKVEQLRKERGLNQDDFAKMLRVSRQTISSIETGKYNPLDLCQYFEHKKLKGYADFFNSSSSFCCGVI